MYRMFNYNYLVYFYTHLFKIHVHVMFAGCPFRHSDPELLKQKLQFYKVSPSGISQVSV